MKTAIVLLFLLPLHSFAGQRVELPSFEFEVNALGAKEKLEDALLNPDGFLERFKPTGATISDKKVFSNEVSFVATKSYLFLSKSVYVNGKLQVKKDSRNCLANFSGYNVSLKFDSSDDLISDNVQSLVADFCVKNVTDKKMVGFIYPRIFLGENYSSVVGPKVINLIKIQLPNLITAITEEISLMK